jgi:hypothetical protein
MNNMLYGFDTDDSNAAVAALLVYAVWRSRDRSRYKVTPDVWSQVTRFVKASAKRSRTLPEFLDRLMPRLACGALHPRAVEVGIRGVIPLVETADGEYIQAAADPEQREFLTGVLRSADHKAVLRLFNYESSLVIALVRDRLEREKVVERRFETVLDAIGVESPQ